MKGFLVLFVIQLVLIIFDLGVKSASAVNKGLIDDVKVVNGLPQVSSSLFLHSETNEVL